MRQEYELYEQQKYDKIQNEIENLNISSLSQIENDRIKFVIKNYANKIFKRNK